MLRYHQFYNNLNMLHKDHFYVCICILYLTLQYIPLLLGCMSSKAYFEPKKSMHMSLDMTGVLQSTSDLKTLPLQFSTGRFGFDNQLLPAN
jgi:hypothetical protein